MKINSVQYNISIKEGKSGFHSGTSKNKGGICDTGYNNTAYCGSFTGKSKSAATFLDKILSSDRFGKFAAYSDKHNISTSALIALVLAGILRPATIMALPGDKDKDDKIYASGHAIATGIIGFLVSTAITSPFDESIRKIFEDGKFQRGNLKKMTERIQELQKIANEKTLDEVTKKELKTLIHKTNALNTLSKNIPDWIIAVPRSILTIALIPLILKYVFGMEKKKKITPVCNINTIDKPVFKQFKPSFGSAYDTTEKIIMESSKGSKFFKPFTDFYENFTDRIADKFTSRFLEWKPLNSIAERFKDSNNLFQHCLTTGSAITSGLYMQRTLTNKEMEKDRRQTLAVNQGLTFLISTLGAYILDKYVKNSWDNVIARFTGHLLNDKEFYSKFMKEKAAAKEKLKNAKNNPVAEEIKIPKVTSWVKNHPYYKKLKSEDAKYLMAKIKGMEALRTMIVFGFIYRFFVPVAVTKPANKLCEIYLKHKRENS